MSTWKERGRNTWKGDGEGDNHLEGQDLLPLAVVRDGLGVEDERRDARRHRARQHLDDIWVPARGRGYTTQKVKRGGGGEFGGA